MRAIVLEKFGGLDSLVYKTLPDPEPKPGHVVIESRHSASTTPRCTCAAASGPKPRK
jgi:NADPH:quinone reductase-like Zn-dependent oxidoreductase